LAHFIMRRGYGLLNFLLPFRTQIHNRLFGLWAADTHWHRVIVAVRFRTIIKGNK